MTAQPVKKKRYEGLIQFQDPLRQTLVCLQASLAERFATGASSDFLKCKDDALASYFLLTNDGSSIGELRKGLESRHLLMRVEQLAEQIPKWAVDPEIKIAAWLNSTDNLTSQYFFQLLAQAVASQTAFDLAQGLSWGSALGDWQICKDQPEAAPWLTSERIKLFDDFHKNAKPLFGKIERQQLSTDGCSVALQLEGPTDLSWKQLAPKALKLLAKNNHHLIALNYVSGPEPRLQCAYLTPMRLPLKELQVSALKGFLLFRDIKEEAKDLKAVLAR